jgi:hypothetical protein
MSEHNHPYPPCPTCAEEYRALEAENIRLGNENRVLHGDRDALRTENAALKIEIADAVWALQRNRIRELEARVVELEVVHDTGYCKRHDSYLGGGDDSELGCLVPFSKKEAP